MPETRGRHPGRQRLPWCRSRGVSRGLRTIHIPQGQKIGDIYKGSWRHSSRDTGNGPEAAACDLTARTTPRHQPPGRLVPRGRRARANARPEDLLSSVATCDSRDGTQRRQGPWAALHPGLSRTRNQASGNYFTARPTDQGILGPPLSPPPSPPRLSQPARVPPPRSTPAALSPHASKQRHRVRCSRSERGCRAGVASAVSSDTTAGAAPCPRPARLPGGHAVRKETASGRISPLTGLRLTERSLSHMRRVRKAGDHPPG